MITPTEKDSVLWRKLVKFFEDRLGILRAHNDNGTMNEVETAYLRGRIAECKDFIKLNKSAESSPDEK